MTRFCVAHSYSSYLQSYTTCVRSSEAMFRSLSVQHDQKHCRGCAPHSSVGDLGERQLVSGGYHLAWTYFLVGGLEPWNFMIFHRLGISSSQLTFIFFRGAGIPPTSFWKHLKLPNHIQAPMDSLFSSQIPMAFASKRLQLSSGLEATTDKSEIRFSEQIGCRLAVSNWQLLWITNQQLWTYWSHYSQL